jgi:hypothetical protein
MKTLREAAKKALEALELEEAQTAYPSHFLEKAMDALRAALASQIVPSDYLDSHQPDAWRTEARNEHGLPVFFCASEVKQAGPGLIPLYTAPSQREWQGLTDKEIECIKGSANRAIGHIRVTAAKLKEKNT